MAGKKRISGGAGGQPKKAKVDDQKPPHIKRITEWLLWLQWRDWACSYFVTALFHLKTSIPIVSGCLRFTSIVVPQGGPDKFLMQKYRSEASLVRTTVPPMLQENI